ncbi:malonyl-CoA decarboxylase [Lutibaculum baratangense]|uniref:Malonyl-CoA decarboxylase n=1 Tax=Lutibaculum baratangense AMV1 TaxID=631454 RepID=V4RSZ4_9HYPH|nr:malonyl-CoA decarboxylase [Lutibaculum baratangense]ESR26250.1 Malonyl-CoA decarboxylase [Lutibaculum baratangense AMV1]
MTTSFFFNDLLSTIVERGRGIIDRRERRPSGRDVVVLANELLGGRGEASGIAIARDLLDGYAELDYAGRTAFFRALAEDFGADPEKLSAAARAYIDDPAVVGAAQKLHHASEPRRQELFRRLNRAPGGTAALVAMRADLVDRLPVHKDFEVVDRDFSHLLSSWFNRGFLVLRRVDWSMPASTLEKIIRYEAVHAINGWDDLRRRIDPPDRRLYAFFHPALVDEPLIFVEVALTKDMPGAIQPILAEERGPIHAEEATTAVFYSISNCQKGLKGVSFGNFLIKQVVEDLERAFPNLRTFVTLSPVPGFRRWLDRERANPQSDALTDADERLLATLEEPEWWLDEDSRKLVQPLLCALAAHYFLRARDGRGRLPDPVARFHLGNGARLERINPFGDTSPKGIADAAGLMVNYLYDPKQIERNHEAFANEGTVAVAPAVRRLLRNVPERKTTAPTNA